MASEKNARLHLFLSNMSLPLGDLLLVSGRLTDIGGATGIPLARIRLQYFHGNETEVSREVMLLTQPPGGIFEDRLNSSSLGRVGMWKVVARFDGSPGYASTMETAVFVIKAKTYVTLRLSNKSISQDQLLFVEGSIFPCLSCVETDLSLILVGPDGRKLTEDLKLTLQGAPYPIGFFNYSFEPRVPGAWSVEALWAGNRVSLGATSGAESFLVTSVGMDIDPFLFLVLIAAVIGAIGVLKVWRRSKRRSRQISKSTGSLIVCLGILSQVAVAAAILRGQLPPLVV